MGTAEGSVVFWTQAQSRYVWSGYDDVTWQHQWKFGHYWIKRGGEDFIRPSEHGTDKAKLNLYDETGTPVSLLAENGELKCFDSAGNKTTLS